MMTLTPIQSGWRVIFAGCVTGRVMRVGEWPWGYMSWSSEEWPGFAERWLGGGFPSRAEPQPLRGWLCPGCGRGFSPEILECRYCGPSGAAPGES